MLLLTDANRRMDATLNREAEKYELQQGAAKDGCFATWTVDTQEECNFVGLSYIQLRIKHVLKSYLILNLLCNNMLI
jgi:hypothetical protein